jgi:hypothetical protein
VQRCGANVTSMHARWRGSRNSADRRWPEVRVFYKWKGRCRGLEVSDAKRLKALEDAKAKLKKLLAEADRLSCGLGGGVLR